MLLRISAGYGLVLGALLSALPAYASDTEDFVTQSCARVGKVACDSTCSGGEFRECWLDPSKVKGSFDWRAHCFAVRVGRNCAPCEQIFTVSGAGMFPEVSCEYYFGAIAKRNASCGNCLKPFRNQSQAQQTAHQPSLKRSAGPADR